MWICTRAELLRLMQVPAQVRDCRRGLAWSESCSSLAEGYPDKEHGVLAQFLGKLREKGLVLISWMLEADLPISISLRHGLANLPVKAWLQSPWLPSLLEGVNVPSSEQCSHS